MQTKDAIARHRNEISGEYANVKEKVQLVNEKLLFLLSELERATHVQQQNIFSGLKSPMPQGSGRSANSFANLLETPRMSIDQYSKSPFAKRKNTKQQLKFSDFEAEITSEQFDKIPSYIRGRLSLAEVQSYLDEVVIKCFNAKYELLYKNRAILKPSDYSLQIFYKEQMGYFDGMKFVTIGDISRIKNVDKKCEKYIQCLRFLNIIKEMRKNSATCYLWVEK